VRNILTEFAKLLAPDGRVVLVEASDRLYQHEWVSFSTSAYPENAEAKSGDPVPGNPPSLGSRWRPGALDQRA
jgi:hypothetical protein